MQCRACAFKDEISPDANMDQCKHIGYRSFDKGLMGSLYVELTQDICCV